MDLVQIVTEKIHAEIRARAPRYEAINVRLLDVRANLTKMMKRGK